MHTDPAPHPDAATDAQTSPGVRTLSDARTWLARMAENGSARIEFQEPPRRLGGELLLVRAALIRADGTRVFIEVYCADDRSPEPSWSDLFPLPAPTVLPGAN